MPHRPLLRLLVALAAAGAVACGGDKSPTQPDTGSNENPDVVKLTISVGAGVLGTPTSTGPYAKGTTISYAYNTQPGYRDLKVTLDGANVAAQGTITMDRAHTLIATATVGSAVLVTR